jgi:hypothetical protein
MIVGGISMKRQARMRLGIESAQCLVADGAFSPFSGVWQVQA